MGVAGEDEIEPARFQRLAQDFRAVAVQNEAPLAGQDEIRRFGAFETGGAGPERGVGQMFAVAVAEGDVGADAVRPADGGNQVHDVFPGIAAMDEMAGAARHQQIQRAPRFAQVVVGIGNQADLHAGKCCPFPRATQSQNALLACSPAGGAPSSPPVMDREAFFDALAGGENPLAFKPEHEPRLERLRRRLGDLRGKRVYEPGCGAGPLTARLAEWVGAAGRVLALDACPGMVARCARETVRHGHVRTVRGKAEEADLEAGAWDLVLCFRLYPHLEDPAAFLACCARALAPGGELVIANLEGSRELNALHARHAGVHGDVMPAGADLARELRAAGWQVAEVCDEPDDFFLRARRA